MSGPWRSLGVYCICRLEAPLGDAQCMLRASCLGPGAACWRSVYVGRRSFSRRANAGVAEFQLLAQGLWSWAQGLSASE